jgi:hypothetical protein
MLHNNARPHTVWQTQQTLWRQKWEVLQHPTHSPNLGPSDFHFYGPFKWHLLGQQFVDDNIIVVVMTLLHAFSRISL